MATYWISQPKKHCDFCKCWIADNRPSIDFHEKGKKHQENVRLRINEVRKKGTEAAKKQASMHDDLKAMEKAALAAFKDDLQSNPSLATQYGVKLKNPENAVKFGIKIKEKSEKPQKDDATTTTTISTKWYECKSDEGYLYYWNNVTGETQWEKPVNASVKLLENTQQEEKIVDIIKPSTEVKFEIKECKDNKQDNHDEEPSKKKSRPSVYGSWVTVKDEIPQPLPDWNLPTSKVQSDDSGSKIDYVADVPKIKFKEKVVKLSDSKDTGPVGFKKRKMGGGSRQIRKRDDDQ